LYRKKPKVLENSNEKNKSSNLYNSKELITNNQELSSGIFPEYVEEINLKELFNCLIRRKKLIFFTTGLFVTFAAVLTTYERVFDPKYRGSFSLLIKDPIEMENSKTSFMNSTPASPFSSLFMGQASGKFPNLVTFLKSSLVLKDFAYKNNLSVGDLASKISIDIPLVNKKLPADGTLEISLTVDDPKTGFLLLNDLKDLYLRTAINQKQIKLQEGLDFLNSQYPSLNARNILLRKELSDFQEKYSLLEPISSAKAIKNEQKKVDALISKNKEGLEKLSKVRKDLLAGKLSAIQFRKTLTSGPDDIFLLVDVDQGLLSRQIALEKQIALDRTVFKPESKVIKSLLARQEELNPIFLRSQLKSIELVIDETKAKIKLQELKRDELEDKFLIKPSLINEYQSIKESIRISETNLLGIRKTQEKYRLDLAEKNVQWKVLSPPSMSSIPFSPNMKFNITLSLLFGTFIGSILALLRDRIDNKFYESIVVQDYLQKNFLGHVSYPSPSQVLNENINLSNYKSKKITQLEPNEGELTKNNDPFKNIFSSLLSCKSFIGIKSLSILTTDYSESASSLNASLAKSLSDIDKNVLLVDLDFRSNELNDKLGINNTKGLSDLIEGEKDLIKDLMMDIKSLKCKILGSGSNIDDPVKLLSSNKLDKIISELNELEEFDYIIYNTTPISSASDVFIYSDKIDGFIYNVSLANIDKNHCKENYLKASLSKLNILGLITNEVELSSINTDYKAFILLEKIEDYLNSLIKKSNNKSVIKFSKALVRFFKVSKSFVISIIN